MSKISLDISARCALKFLQVVINHHEIVLNKATWSSTDEWLEYHETLQRLLRIVTVVPCVVSLIEKLAGP